MGKINLENVACGVDIETTGLKFDRGHKIIEVGLVLVDLDNLEVIWRKSQRFDPKRKIDATAEAVHHISLEQLDGEPTFDQHAATIARILNQSAIVVAHNSDFDLPFLTHELKQNGEILEPKVVLCTMKNGRWATDTGKVPNLGELAFACGFDYDQEAAHSALYDTELMMKCFVKQKDRFLSPTE